MVTIFFKWWIVSPPQGALEIIAYVGENYSITSFRTSHTLTVKRRSYM
jgi:hypothetical protein